MFLLLFLGCDDNPVSPEIDCAGVSGGSAVINECDLCVGGISDVVDLCDVNEDGYDDRDIQVLQDFININESLNNLDLTIQLPIWVEANVTIWNTEGRLIQFGFPGQFTNIPESIGQLDALEILFLSYNEITSIPESIGDLSSLEQLMLDYNQIISIPESIGALSSLRTLYLQDNQLTSIPESIGDLSSLSTLYLGSNQLTSIPESLCDLYNILRISLGNNQISFIPECIIETNITELLISNNSLISLPEDFCDILSNQNPSNILEFWTVNVSNNYLCEEYHYDCIDDWGTQDQTNCCEGTNNSGELDPNWTTCP